MRLKLFAESAAEICCHTQAAAGRRLRWAIIANPVAGGFTMRSRWKKCRAALEKCREAAWVNPLRDDCAPAACAADFGAPPHLAGLGFVPTTGPGFAGIFAAALIAEIAAEVSAAAAKKNVPFYLIITAGGDGTSLEVLSTLFNAPVEVRNNIAILRLPMGTGNDGADSFEPETALNLLIRPSRITFSPALRLLPAVNGSARQGGPYLAFNILSVGLDAFVTHMTNKMKGKLPGDFYKFWVDIASLLYDRLYTVDTLDVRAWDERGGETCFSEKLLLLAVGASGRRTYGSQKKILPDDRNVCAVKQMPLLRKLEFKGLFNTGTHVDKPESILFNAARVEFSGRYPILAQMDGETILLRPEDFPAVIELTDPVIPLLKLCE